MRNIIFIISALIGCKPVSNLSSLDSNGGQCSQGMKESNQLSTHKNEISGLDTLNGDTYVISDDHTELGLVSGNNVMWQGFGAGGSDWEALAIGQCPNSGGNNCAYIAAMGDNGLGNGGGQIHVVKIAGRGSYQLLGTLYVKFSDHQSHNVEALAIDSKAPYDLFIIHKHWRSDGKTDNSSKVWKLPHSSLANYGSTVTVNPVCDMVYGNSWENQITGADIKDDIMVYRGYHYVQAMDMTKLRNNVCEDIPSSHFSHHVDDDKSEAIAFTDDSGGLLTINEDNKSFVGSICTDLGNPDSNWGTNEIGPREDFGNTPPPALGDPFSGDAMLPPPNKNMGAIGNGIGGVPPSNKKNTGIGSGTGSEHKGYKGAYCSWVKTNSIYKLPWIKSFADNYCGF